MQSSRVLVTGALGFIGRGLVDRLLEDGVGVRILTRGKRNLPDNWIGKVEIWTADLTKPSTLVGIADGIDVVYHLAGEIRNPRLYDAVNQDGPYVKTEFPGGAGISGGGPAGATPRVLSVC